MCHAEIMAKREYLPEAFRVHYEECAFVRRIFGVMVEMRGGMGGGGCKGRC